MRSSTPAGHRPSGRLGNRRYQCTVRHSLRHHGLPVDFSRRQKSLSTRKAHTTSVHAKRQAKKRKRRRQRNSNPEAQRPLLRCAPWLAGESGPGASSSPRPHLTSATASGRGARSQEAKYAAQHAREISHSQGSQRRASLGKRPSVEAGQRFARA